MHLRSTIRSYTGRRRTGVLLAQITAVLSAPIIMYAFSSNPPTPYSGAPGEGTCASCHGTLTAGSGVAVTFPSTTYTPGGAAVSWTVTIPATGGFELSARLQTDNSQAGNLTAGAASNVVSGTVQYVRSSSSGTSWTFQWTPPSANVGNVVVYVTGGAHNANFSNSYTLTPAAVTTPETLTLSTASLTFTYNGTAAPSQLVQVTSSGAPIPVTTSVSTTDGANWLTATPPGGSTPLPVAVSVNPAGLAVGTYTGTVTIASTGATNSPQTVAVTFAVTTVTPPILPTLVLSSASLSFTAPVGGTAVPKTVQVTSSGSNVMFTAAASGGNWLFVSPTTASTPSAEMISVAITGLAAGTYSGAVTFSSSGASNSPVTLNVTLTVTSTTPPPTPSVDFSFNVTDRQSGGTDRLLLDGTGSVDPGGSVTGSGSFTRYGARSGGADDDGEHGSAPPVVASGTWKATSVTSFTPASGAGGEGGEGGRRRGGILVLAVQISTQGGSSSSGTMRIASTGSDRGVTLDIDGGATFVPTGIGRVSITRSGGSGGGGGETGDDALGRSRN